MTLACHIVVLVASPLLGIYLLFAVAWGVCAPLRSTTCAHLLCAFGAAGMGRHVCSERSRHRCSRNLTELRRSGGQLVWRALGSV